MEIQLKENQKGIVRIEEAILESMIHLKQKAKEEALKAIQEGNAAVRNGVIVYI